MDGITETKPTSGASPPSQSLVYDTMEQTHEIVHKNTILPMDEHSHFTENTTTTALGGSGFLPKQPRSPTKIAKHPRKRKASGAQLDTSGHSTPKKNKTMSLRDETLVRSGFFEFDGSYVHLPAIDGEQTRDHQTKDDFPTSGLPESEWMRGAENGKSASFKDEEVVKDSLKNRPSEVHWMQGVEDGGFANSGNDDVVEKANDFNLDNIDPQTDEGEQWPTFRGDSSLYRGEIEWLHSSPSTRFRKDPKTEKEAEHISNVQANVKPRQYQQHEDTIYGTQDSRAANPNPLSDEVQDLSRPPNASPSTQSKLLKVLIPVKQHLVPKKREEGRKRLTKPQIKPKSSGQPSTWKGRLRSRICHRGWISHTYYRLIDREYLKTSIQCSRW